LAFPKSNFSFFDQIYTKMHQYHQISFIKFFMKSVLIVHLFELVDVNIFSKNLVKVREV